MKKSIPLVLLLVIPATALGGYRASSYRKEARKGDNYWNASAAIDGSPESCWMVDPEDDNAGQWIEIDVPKSEVDQIAMQVGWEKSDETFLDYARVKTVRVEVYSLEDVLSDEGKQVLEQTITFEDKRGWQHMDLPDTKVGGEYAGGRVRLVVTEVYEGRDFPNLAVSEVLIQLKEMDAPATFSGDEPAAAEPSHTADLMLDGSEKSYFVAEGSPQFSLQAEGFGLSSLGVTQGPKGYGHAKTIEVTANDVVKQYTLEDKPGVQWLSLPAVVGYSGSAWGTVEVKVVDVYAGAKPGVAIAEIALKATNYEGI